MSPTPPGPGRGELMYKANQDIGYMLPRFLHVYDAVNVVYYYTGC